MDHEVFKTKSIKYDECQKGLTSMFYKFVDKSSTATRANKSITHTGIGLINFFILRTNVYQI